MEGFKTIVPTPRPIRHSRVFNEEELIKALVFYLKSEGIQIPTGKAFICGMYHDHDDSEKITLVIDE